MSGTVVHAPPAKAAEAGATAKIVNGDGRGPDPQGGGGEGRLARLPAGMQQFVKFAVVGGIGTVVNLAVFSLIVYAWGAAHGGRPLAVEQVASDLAFFTAVVSNFVLNRVWTFHHDGPVLGNFTRFFIVSLVGLGLNLLAFTAFHHWLGVEEVVSQLLAIAVVTPCNFIGSKLWAFREPAPSARKAASRAT
jgi:putative flippase GtrA